MLNKKEERAIIVFNAGSSSLKFTLFSASKAKEICRGNIDNITEKSELKITSTEEKVLFQTKDLKPGYEEGFVKIKKWLEKYYGKYNIIGIAHRVVHGGQKFHQPVKLNDEIIGELEKLKTLAPLHQPQNLEIINLCKKHYPKIPQVACFDTAFHRTKTPESDMIPVPRKFAKQGIIRYGFHGLSYEYVTSVIPDLTSLKACEKIIIAHLGNGSSMCAVDNLESIDTTMSFTPLDGLMMGTRCGDIDPGLVLYFIKNLGMHVDEVYDMLYNKSGLLGVSGISGDVRDLLNNYSKEAEEAIGMFAYRAVKQLGGLVAAMGGLDAIIFTGGMGENSPVIREAICSRLGWYGVHLDFDANEKNKMNIGSRASKVDVYVIHTNEAKMMFKHCKSVLGL
jgi:acetate kinase